MIQVFLSSTARDLSECRAVTYRAIEGLAGYHCVRMEDFGAWDLVSGDLCLRRVAECDLFIILAGPLYGSISDTGKSYTELEYDCAEALNMACLSFLSTENFLIPASLVESATNRRKQEAFRRRIRDTKTVTWFKNCADLATMVIQAIHNWESSPNEHSLLRVWRSDSPESFRDFRRPFLRLGRNPESEIQISSDLNVSWDHGAIYKHAGEFYYRHLSQTNPAWIAAGPRQIVLRPGEMQEVMLAARNEIKIGNTTLTVNVTLSGGRPKVVATNKQAENG
jgi:hypothetical protein